MANEEVLISGIGYKVRKILENNSKLYKENQELKQKVGEMEQLVKKLKENIDLKNNELFKLSIANTLENEIGVEEGIDKINSLLVDINRCIEVLSE